MNSPRFGLICLLLAALLCLLFEQTDAQDAYRLGMACDLDGAVAATVTDWNVSYEARALSIDELKALAGMTGEPIAWLPDGLYGRFDAPTFAEWPIEYDVWLESGDVQYVFVWTRDATAYVFGYDDLAVTTDALGQHEGAHHLCAFMRVSSGG